MTQHRGSVGASHPPDPGLILGIPKNFIIQDVDEIYQGRLDRGKLENVD